MEVFLIGLISSTFRVATPLIFGTLGELFAEKSGIPVLPVGIVGTTEDFWYRGIRGQRPPLELRIGKLIDLPPIDGTGVERKESRQRNADLVMATIAGLLPEEYRGAYADRAIEPS